MRLLFHVFKSHGDLECAPVPIPRYTGSNFWSLGKERTVSWPSCDGSSGSITSRVGGSGAGGLAVISTVPNLVLLEAVVAGSRRDGTRIELGVLIQGDHVTGMRITEDVAALPAVVSTGEIVEVPFASRIVAECGLGIGLEAKG